jgi:hypothetical protein
MASMHGRFSRWIGPLPRPQPGFVGWLILAAVVGVLLLALVTHRVGTLSTIAVLVVLSVVSERNRSERVRAIANQRANEDIGSFARAFNRRATDPLDPWAIRAVWNALVPLTESRGRTIPLRPTDRFEEDLSTHPDDIEDLVLQLVEQCERVPGNWRANPFYDRIKTVADLVYFISAQPLRQSA